MNREQAINYLRSSGMSEKQIDAITDAFENPYLKAFEDIRAEIDGYDDTDLIKVKYVRQFIDKHDPAKAGKETDE